MILHVHVSIQNWYWISHVQYVYLDCHHDYFVSDESLFTGGIISGWFLGGLFTILLSRVSAPVTSDSLGWFWCVWAAIGHDASSLQRIDDSILLDLVVWMDGSGLTCSANNDKKPMEIGIFQQLSAREQVVYHRKSSMNRLPPCREDENWIMSSCSS